MVVRVSGKMGSTELKGKIGAKELEWLYNALLMINSKHQIFQLPPQHVFEAPSDLL